MSKKNFLFLLLAVCMFCFAACGNTDGSGGNGNGDRIPESVISQSVMVCDFETQDDIYNLSFPYGRYFGKYSLNKLLEYVSHGEGSVKLEPQGDGSGVGAKPILVFQLSKFESDDETKDNYNLRDFLRVEYIVFDVYNDSAEAKSVFANMVYGANNDTMPELEFVLNAKGWTTCVYPVNYRYTSIGFDLENAFSFQITFEPVHYSQESPIFYLDNLVLKYANSAQTSALIEPDNNEICSFDKDYQKFVMISFVAGSYGDRTCYPAFEINKNPVYTKNGVGQSLRVNIAAGKTVDSSWPQFTLASKMVKAFDFSKYSADDEIVFDIFAEKMLFSSQFRIGHLEPYLVYSQSVSCEKGKWTEIRIRLGDVATYFNKGVSTDNMEKLAGIDFFNFIFGERTQNQTIYLDNIRIEISGGN